MDKEFIPYEQALELKELGFDELCLAFYDGKETNQVYYNSIRNGSGDYGPFKNNERLKWFGAPLYQQAFRLFREKHKLNSRITKHINDNKYFYCIERLNVTKFEDVVVTWNTDMSISYEEAELACLIKLIEICQKSES